MNKNHFHIKLIDLLITDNGSMFTYLTSKLGDFVRFKYEFDSQINDNHREWKYCAILKALKNYHK